MTIQTFLHVGCGAKHKDRTTREFSTERWTEVRLDIDPQAQPDFVGTMLDMSDVADASMDAVFSSHNIEHLYVHELPQAFAEFLRVLKPNGYLVVTCPDLKSVCQLVVQDQLTDAVYQSPSGPIAPIDILYGYRPSLAHGNLYMAHRSGFTLKTLIASLRRNGFASVGAIERGRAPHFDLWAIATKSLQTNEEVKALAELHFPGAVQA
ncbi:class I SAM-dependent methyltransferase [Rhodoferax sp. GW822-FHT02A01]|uniref:class I SAM-dependent methyltransferase n=1 Tax=Rhodoferax sp. GW822-FHT02A01 TaxID=3141537 RepID=UPI00315D822E